jgi:hypothetical protein
MSELPEGVLPKSRVPSNRDRSRHSADLGRDGKDVLTAQYREHAGNREISAGDIPDDVGKFRDLVEPQTDEAGAQSSLETWQTARDGP